MNKQEFFLLIPAIIYGVAVVDLMKIFQHRKNYWEVIIWGIYIFMSIVFMWTELFEKLGNLTTDIKNFFLIIIQSIVMAQVVSVITPEEKDIDTEYYFLSQRRRFFLLLAGLGTMNILMELVVFDDGRPSWMRPIFIILSLICAFIDKIWLRTSIWLFLFVTGLYIIFGS